MFVLTMLNMDAAVTVNIYPCALWPAFRLECYLILTLVCYLGPSCCCLTKKLTDGDQRP